ncbi:MAG: sulfatase-like hydrolase/transferase [Prolixibacteraceae bacterium]|nr:sulfatase-like hydrolase/transferase [Prolixibacteraceae bacterium]MBT6999312.1 sulfatase-like hydrolase/transferase [Prolixibacteraceae bacterium]MBT7393208.1 sulfatase-like hydrolase/transferase [Prolixibacteraceae bacterium]
MKYPIYLLFCFTFLSISCKQKTNVPKKPNILFIFADDQTYLGVNALGNKELITPNLDKLAHSGVTFTHTYNMGGWNGAVCVASRAMLNTGRFIWKANKAEKNYQTMKESGQFWSQMMENAGYDTYMTGKWHVKQGAETIFQNVSHIRPGMPKTVPESYNRPHSPKDTTWLPWHTKYGGFWEGGKHWSEIIGDNAIKYLNQSKESENPFFMYLAFNAPHDPRQSPKEFVDMYPLEKVAVPRSYQELYPYKDSIGCGPGLRDEKLAPFPRTEYSIKVHRQEYYAIITHMDEQIGRIISYLKETGQEKNTYIMFGADHGLSVGNHGLVGKQNMYDHSMRVPCILVGPNIPENEKREAQIYVQDLMATSLDLAGIEKPKYVEFNSLMPLLNREVQESPYPEIYGAYINLQRMVRTDEFKMIIYPKAHKLLLFNIINDPDEMINLANNPEYKTVIIELAERFKKQQKIMDDPLDLHPYFPELF